MLVTPQTIPALLKYVLPICAQGLSQFATYVQTSKSHYQLVVSNFFFPLPEPIPLLSSLYLKVLTLEVNSSLWPISPLFPFFCTTT